MGSGGPSKGRFPSRNRVEEGRREEKHVKVEAMTSEVITIKVGSHAMLIPSEDGAKVIPSDETEAGTSSTQVAGLTDALRPV